MAMESPLLAQDADASVAKLRRAPGSCQSSAAAPDRAVGTTGGVRSTARAVGRARA
jgi:hypothetical protein